MKHIQRQQFSFRKTSIKVSLNILSLQASSLSLCFKPASRCLIFSKTNKMMLGSFPEKKKCIVLKGKKLFFSLKQPCHRTSSNFILSMFSRKIYSKFYVVFTTYKNAKIIKKKLLERYSVKKYF